MSEYVDQYVQQIADAVRAEYEEIGKDMLEEMRDLISTPWPPSSNPDDPPNLRTGQYSREMYYQVIPDGKLAFELVLQNDLPLSVWLENGTDKMAARPHFSVIYSAWVNQAEERIQTAAQEAADNPKT